MADFLTPPLFGGLFTPQKLEGWSYRMVKISWSNLQPFLYESPVRQTDRRTGDSTVREAYIGPYAMLSRTKNGSFSYPPLFDA